MARTEGLAANDAAYEPEGSLVTTASDRPAQLELHGDERQEPGYELQLIERLASRSGAGSATLFGAFDLGAAYHRDGKYNSKRAKIAVALHAARL